MPKISILPYVCGAGASKPGAEQGPVYASRHGLIERLGACGIGAEWALDPETRWNGPYGRIAHENLPPRGDAARREIVEWSVRAMAENVALEIGRGRRVVTLGGDHSLAAGSVAGVRAALGPQARIGLLWVDAHPDLHTYESSTSKALHGMPVASLAGLDSTLTLPGSPGPALLAEDVLYVGLRDIDEGEIKNAESLGLRLLRMEDLRRGGIARTVQSAAADLLARCDALVLSLDIDGFSPDIAPATGTPVPGGFMPDEILPVLAGIVRGHNVPLIDIVEFNPTLPGAEKTFDFIVSIFDALLPRDKPKNALS